MAGNYISSERFDVIKVRIEEVNVDTTDPRVQIYDEATNEFVQKPRPMAQGRDLQAYGLIIIDLTYSGIKPNVGEIWWCKRTGGRWVLDHIVTDNLIERGGTSEGGAVVNRPGVPSNLVFDFNVYERNGGIEYVPYVTFDKVTYDENNNKISVLYYVINYRPCTSAGDAVDSDDIHEFIWAANDETIDAVNDPNGQFKVLLPGKITNPKTTYWQARIRAVRKTNDLGQWGDWTTPKLPVNSSESTPPSPGTITTQYTGILVANDTQVRYGFKVSFNDVGFWAIPGGDFIEDVNAYQIQLMAIRTPTTIPVSAEIRFTDSTDTVWEIAPALLERVEIKDSDNAEEEVWATYGTLSSNVNNSTNVMPISINPAYESRNPATSPFIIRIGDEKMYAYDKDTNQNLLVYRQIGNVAAEAYDSGDTVQILIDTKKYSVIFGPLDQPQNWYRVARVRTIDRYGRIGEWSDWTDPILSIPDNSTLVVTKDSSVNDGPRRFDTYVDGSLDIKETSITGNSISKQTITSSELSQIISIGEATSGGLQKIKVSSTEYNGYLELNEEGLKLKNGDTTVVLLPVNGTSAYFKGQVTASALDATDARIAGSSRIPQASTLTISGGQIKAPSTSPSTSLIYPNSLPWAMAVGSTASTGNKWNLWVDSAGGYSGNIKSVWTAVPYSANTAREWEIGTISGAVTTLGSSAVKYRDITVAGECHAIARISDMIFVMFYRSSSSMYINAYDRGVGSALLYTQSITTYGYEPTLVPDPSNNALIVIDSNISSGTNTALRIRSFSVTTSGTTKGLLTLQSTATISVSGFSNISVMSLNATFSSNNTLYIGVADTVKERVLKYTVARNSNGYIGTNSVTFTGSAGSPANTVTLNNHGFTAGNSVSFSSISTTTGISTSTRYYVINTTTNTFQLSDTIGGSAKVLTNNGTGTINAITANTGQDDSEFSMPWGSVAPWGFAWDSTLNSGAGGFWVHDGTTTDLYSTNPYSDASTYNFSYAFAKSPSVTFTGTGSPTNYVSLTDHLLTDNTPVIFSSITTTTGIFTNKVYYAVGPAVTFQTSTNTVTLPGHGLTAGTAVSFSSITTTSEIFISTTYYVVNPATNTFQLADTVGGAAKTLTNNGTGILSSVTPNVFALADTSGGAIKTLTGNGTGTLFYTTPLSSTRSIVKKPFANVVVASTQTTSGLANQYAFYAQKTSGITATTASVTFQPSTTNTVTLNNHGLTTGTAVSFTSITSTTGISINTIYYVINPTTNTFQLSDTVGGTVKTLTNSGSGTLNYWPTNLLQSIGTTSSASLEKITNVNPASGTQITPALSTNTFPNQTAGKLTAETSGAATTGIGWSLNGDGTTSGIIPVGLVSPYAGASAPTGWFICDGSGFSSTTYPALAAVLGDTYAVHSGTTYYLPNLKQRFPLGKTSTAAVTGSTLGATGGTIDHGHTVSEISASNHTHESGNLNVGTDSGSHSTGHNTGAESGHQHDVSGTTATGGAHLHGVSATAVTARNEGNATGLVASQNHTHSTDQEPAHSHGAGNLAAGASSGHQHGVSGAGNHQHGASNFAGSTAGGGTHGHSPGVSTSSASNPPFLVLNYIIKY